MFTGIVKDVGSVLEVGEKLKVLTNLRMDYVEIGSSVAFSGVCLTITEKGKDDSNKDWLCADVSNETLDKTNLKFLNIGWDVNIECSLKAGDEIGGHFVLGHVDCCAKITEITASGNCDIFTFLCPKEFIKYIVYKGSVAIDGTSLTVNSVKDCSFSVMIIPHTKSVTSFRSRKVGDEVNLEVDMFARYVEGILSSYNLVSSGG